MKTELCEDFKKWLDDELPKDLRDCQYDDLATAVEVYLESGFLSDENATALYKMMCMQLTYCGA